MKKLIVVGAILLALGLVVGFVSFALMGFRFSGFGTAELHPVTRELEGDFRNIHIQSETENVTLRRTPEKTPKLEYREGDKLRYTVSLENGTLFIRRVDERKWYDRAAFWTTTTELVLYLPEEDYGDLTVENSTGDTSIPGSFTFHSIKVTCSTGDAALEASAETIAVKTGTGDIRLGSLTAGDITLKVSTGRVQVEKVRCDTLVTEGDTGKTFLVDVAAEQRITVKRSTGDVSFSACDAPEIRVNTDTGDVRGSLLTGKEFITSTHTGDVDVPKNDASGGTCEIHTNTGDIVIEITK